jgi:DNA-binding CsgD family transcriptional regulator
MDSPLATSVVCPILIGRAPQLAALDRLIEQAGGGHGQAAAVAGEAGMGKSRLVAEACARAAGRGFAVLVGRCFEPDRALPYAPLIDLLRTHLGVRPPEAIMGALGPMAPHLVGLLPEFAPLVTGVASPPALDPQQERGRVAHSFARFLAYQSVDRPLLLVIEDLHWCDDASLDVLLTLARRAASQPLLLLLTYRSDELHPGLAGMLATLERERLSSEIQVTSFDETELDAMLRVIFDQRRPIRGEFLSTLYGLTEGNPFFVEEVLKSLIAAGDIFYARGQWDRKPLGELNIPRTVQVAVHRRVELLSAEARRLLTLAAVAGRRFDFDLLHALTGHDERELLELIKELIAAQLVIEESAETFAFRHALTREALYGDLLARERRALHGAIAEALEAIVQARASEPRDVWMGDLAYHSFEAGLWARALEYARQAGQHAQRRYAPRAAIEHLSRAIVAAGQLAAQPQPSLYRDRGRMHDTLGAFEQAHDDYQAALRSARALGDRHTEWQALLDIGFLWASRDAATMSEYLQGALALARSLNDPIMLGHSLNRVGNWYLVAEQPRAALRYHQEALALFQASGDRHGLAETFDLLGSTYVMGDDILAGVAQYEQAVALFRELGHLQGLLSSLTVLAMRGASYPWSATVWPVVPAADCIRDGEEALRIARQIDWRAGEANALVYLAFGYGPRGEYQLALEQARAASEIAQEIDHSGWMVGAWVALGAIALDLLALNQARQYLEQAHARAGELGSFFTRIAAGLLASACVAQHDFARAEDVLAGALDPDTAMETRGQRLAWCARAELSLAAGAPAPALEIVDRLIDSALNADIYGEGSVPRLWRLRGDALAAIGRTAEAEAALLAADAGAEARGLLPMRWRILASLGRLYQSQGRRKQAEMAFAATRAIVDHLAAAVPDAELRTAFLRSTSALIPRPPAPTPRRATKHAYDGLTEREREVATQIARGLSNHEIAEALVLSERTVATHVSNILAKLDYTTRAQIAAWASDKGLTKPR